MPTAAPVTRNQPTRPVLGVVLSCCLCLGASALPAGAAPMAAVATGAAATAAAAPASDVVAPDIRNVAISGVDRAVLSAAPAPHHEHEDGGSVEAQALPAGELRPAVAASVSTVDRPAELVAVTADAPFPDGTAVQVRVQERSGWSAWETLGVDDGHGPDPGSAEASQARVGSDPLMSLAATRVQVRIDTPTGRVPAGTGLTLVTAPTAATDGTLAAVPPRAPVTTQAVVPRPSIVTRAQWGANESWRSRSPHYTGAIKAGFLHHTASTSSYTPAQAPAQVRAIYAYHTRSLGHSDIDYNFLVDRFGRLYEGRAGGIDRAVLGAHTAGFNENTFAIVALGNFQSTAPGATHLAAIKDTVARVFAWKLGLYGVSPVGTARLVSAGFVRPTKYPKGSVATIPTLSSHQMVNYTSCPGTHLQRELPAIRALAGRYSHLVLSAPTPAAVSFQADSRSSATITSRADRAVRWRADVLTPCSDRPVRSYTGKTTRAAAVKVTWDLRDGRGEAVLPASYTIRLSGTAADGTAVPAVAARVTMTPAPGRAWGPCANVWRIAGAGEAATSVLWGKAMAPAARTVVLTAPATDSSAALAAAAAAGPLARHLRAAMLITPRTALAAEVGAELDARRATQALVVGSAAVVSDTVVRAVRARGVAVTRIAGATPEATAAAVATRFPAGAPAVLVAPDAPAHTLAGAALAGARDVPVLLASGWSVPSVTRAALATRRSVTVVAPTNLPTRAVTQALAAGTAWTRLAGSDEVSAGAAAAGGTATSTSRIAVLPHSRTAWGSAGLAAATGTPLLFTSGSGLSAQVSAFVTSRAALRSAVTPAPASQLGDEVLGATSRIIASAAAPRYRLSRSNATPEPVRTGAKLTVKATVEVPTASGGWAKAPAGQLVVLQFKAAGARSYAEVLRTRTTTTGRAKVTATARTTGRWRLVIGGVTTRSDKVVVRR